MFLDIYLYEEFVSLTHDVFLTFCYYCIMGDGFGSLDSMVHCVVGDSRDTYFWKDNWVGYSSLCSKFSNLY